MAQVESRYVEQEGYLSQLVHEQELAFRETEGHLATEFGSEAEWIRCVNEEFPKFLINELVNGLTQARYAFIGTKRSR